MARLRTPEQIKKLIGKLEMEDYLRFQKKLLRSELTAPKLPKPAKIPKGSVHNRSSYAWARQHRGVEKLVASNDTGPVEFLPERVPALTNVKSTFAVKNVVEYIVVHRDGKREFIIARGFTKCCPPEKHCKRKRCAKCWVIDQKALPKNQDYVVREIISGATPKIVDPFGVHPKGKRSGGKNLDMETRAQFRLTSSQAHYKAGAAGWGEE